MKPAIYSTLSTQDVASFLESTQSLIKSGQETRAVLDSVRAQVENGTGTVMPKMLGELLGSMTEKDEVRVLDAVTEGVSAFHDSHGVMPTADVVEAAIQQGMSAFKGIDQRGNILDSATSNRHDQISLQPNRAVVAILTAIAEAIPFASYLPVDIASNQSKLAIVSHLADSLYGDYVKGGLMDGIAAGDVYTSSQRMAKFDITGTQPFNTKIAQTNLTATPGYCDPAGTGIPVLRGRTIIFVNGVPVGTDSASGAAANSPLSLTASIGVTSYAIAGFVTVATGVVQLTTVSPTFPVGTEVIAQGFVDYEAAPALIPNVIVRADVYDIFANPWRVKTGISIDAQGQIRNELGLDANSEALMAIRTQMAMERHYQSLRMAWNLGYNNQVSYDFQYSTQILQKTRSQIWQDFASVIANADQKMANDTMDHGITHLYVPAFVAAQMQSLPSELFVSSGIAARPGIYRVGRLFGKYEVYYSPKVVTQATNLTTATILAVGRSSQVARCPIVLGDAVSPTFLPLAMGSDLVAGSAMYARDFTVANPHLPSALGCARINITNLA
ncbi:MAG: hypothetical protein H7293_20060 [Candidatus Saccharibacteria bacterium]|nr:hypothetical protein [Rhodoferax sp.]